MKNRCQSAYQKHLIQCINAQCEKTKQHVGQHKAVFANNRHSAGFTEVLKELTFALVVNKARDAYIRDLDENEYLDISMGFGVHLFGHSPGFIKAAIGEQLSSGIALGPLYEHSAEAAERICNMTGNDRCAFFNSGTEAVMVALRLARAATAKDKIVIFEGAYHGTHDSLLAMKQHPVSQEAIANVPGISPALVKDTVLLKFGTAESLQYIESHAQQIAAVLTEPVRSRHPEEVNPAYLKELGRVCREHNIAFILDEVITGFRVSNGGAKALYSLEPDMVTYGKILGGGLPIGVVAGKRKFVDFIDGGAWKYSDDSKPGSATFVAGTFCNHPLTMATAVATLKFLEENSGLQKELTDMTASFCACINTFCLSERIPVSVANFGSLFRFLIKGNHRLLYPALLKEKVYIWEGRNCFLSSAHGPEELSILEHRVKKCLIEMKASGFFPESKTVSYRDPDDWYLRAAITIDDTLDTDWLMLSFNYVCEQANVNRQYPLSYAMDSGDGPAATNNIHLSVKEEHGQTRLHLSAIKSAVDGWSLILMLRSMGKCYEALEKGRPLPGSVFDDRDKMNNWLGNIEVKSSIVKASEAFTLTEFLPASSYEQAPAATLFEYLLAKFACTLGIGEHHIGVPLSGQLAARLINSFGSYSCLIPIRITSANTDFPLADIKCQLKEGRKNFRHFYSLRGARRFSAVFNMDNLLHENSFAGRKARIVPLSDSHSNHPIVCNVIAEKEGLHVSLKYMTEIPEEDARNMLRTFCAEITSTAYVY